MLAIGCDSAGYPLKCIICAYLDEKKIPYTDFGCEGESCDYPDKAALVAGAVANGQCETGLLVCGTGIGMSMVANKFAGVRAACCSDYFSAKMTRAHNDANILCLGARVIGSGLALELVEVFLNTPFEGGRHARRVEMIHTLEKNGGQ